MKKVAITGIGVVSSMGFLQEFWQNLLQCKSYIKEASRFDSARYRSKLTATLDYEKILRESGMVFGNNNQCLCTKLGLIACKQALDNAGIRNKDDISQAGISIGTTSGGELDTFITECYHGEKVKEATHANFPIYSAIAGIADYFNLNGPVSNISAACASGTSSIIFAYEKIKNNESNIMLAGGCDVLQEIAFAGFNSIRVVAPEKCTPFLAGRRGIIMGDGAAILVLEEYESAQKRGAKILAEITGIGMSCDAYHATAPDSIGAERAMRAALEGANLKPQDIQYVNCHGTGTIFNDRAENNALNRIFEDHISTLYAGSTKATLGHLLGTAGSIEAVISTLVLETQTIPPAPFNGEKDQDVNFKLAFDEPVKTKVKNVMSNSFGFGGNNASIIFSKN